MHKRIAIGLIVLIFVLGVVSVFVMLQPDPETETETVYTDIDPVEIEHGVSSKPPRPAREGYKWENHGDHWHEVPIPNSEVVLGPGNDSSKVLDVPDYIYNPNREKPDGWDPKLVYKTGDKKIDLNFFRPLTQEEQAEYERLKTEHLELYGTNIEANLRFEAIVHGQTELMLRRRAARGTAEHDKLMAEYDRLYGRFPLALSD